jgi:hypothetical protein
LAFQDRTRRTKRVFPVYLPIRAVNLHTSRHQPTPPVLKLDSETQQARRHQPEESQRPQDAFATVASIQNLTPPSESVTNNPVPGSPVEPGAFAQALLPRRRSHRRVRSRCRSRSAARPGARPRSGQQGSTSRPPPAEQVSLAPRAESAGRYASTNRSWKPPLPTISRKWITARNGFCRRKPAWNSNCQTRGLDRSLHIKTSAAARAGFAVDPFACC